MEYPKALENLIIEFMKYPGIGRKTAERYALYTVNELSNEDVTDFKEALEKAKKVIHPCPVCHHLTDHELCEICSDHERNHSILMVVESSKDVFSIEKSNMFHGVYHVLGGAISPMNGITSQDIHLDTLWPRITDEAIKEVILATSGTQEGETTAMYIKKVLENLDLTVSRIGYGVPVGTNLEYADEATLLKAIENRKVF